ncbi:MAG: DHH family phosphoesterase [Lachnospiraceae bacterium]|nr:DHH family phosphoesterase [Lachnospiraceae bacterium]
MILDEIAKHKYITIQCHNEPDADSIAAGYGLYTYFTSLGGHEVDLIYGGHNKLTKKNFVTMVERLNIPLTYVTPHYEVKGILVTVDCQYGSGNIYRFKSDHIAVIDHHQPEPLSDNTISDIRPEYGSCSTIVWQLLAEKGFPIKDYPALQTALYYGLYLDTTSFYEMYHPADRHMLDSLNPDLELIHQLNNSNLSSEELALAGMAMMRAIINDKLHFAILRADRCTSNILGLISDIVLQVDTINTCVVFAEHNEYIKFSVRSCEKSLRANEIASFFADNIGNGGGHYDKAGGTIKKKSYLKRYPDTHLESYFSMCYRQFLL